MELSDVPPIFGWELVLFESPVDEPTSEITFENCFGPCAVAPGSEPVFEPSENQTRPGHVFLDRLDEVFINLDQVEDLEESDDKSDSPTKIVQPKPVQCPKPGEWGPRHRFKTFASQIDLSLVRRPRTRHYGSSSAPYQPTETTPPPPSKSCTNPSTKSSKKFFSKNLQHSQIHRTF